MILPFVTCLSMWCPNPHGLYVAFLSSRTRTSLQHGGWAPRGKMWMLPAPLWLELRSPRKLCPPHSIGRHMSQVQLSFKGWGSRFPPFMGRASKSQYDGHRETWFIGAIFPILPHHPWTSPHSILSLSPWQVDAHAQGALLSPVMKTEGLLLESTSPPALFSGNWMWYKQEINMGCVKPLILQGLFIYFFKFFLNFYLFIFIFGCVGSSFLCEGFL